MFFFLVVVDMNMLTGLHWLRTRYNDGFLHSVMKIRVLIDIESFDEPNKFKLFNTILG
jgi:hypothetical protein